MPLTGLGSRLSLLAPRLSRSLQSKAALKPIPPQRESISTPHDFLKAIGRSCDTLISIEGWEAFWRTSGVEMKKAGLPVQERRYILWCMQKYRMGWDVSDFAHEPKPKKKIRGHGPAVQNGKRIRSRRKQ